MFGLISKKQLLKYMEIRKESAELLLILYKDGSSDKMYQRGQAWQAHCIIGDINMGILHAGPLGIFHRWRHRRAITKMMNEVVPEDPDITSQQ